MSSDCSRRLKQSNCWRNQRNERYTDGDEASGIAPSRSEGRARRGPFSSASAEQSERWIVSESELIKSKETHLVSDESLRSAKEEVGQDPLDKRLGAESSLDELIGRDAVLLSLEWAQDRSVSGMPR